MIKKVKQNIAKFLANFVPNAVIEQLKVKLNSSADYHQLFYSQEGEEIVLRRYFNYKNKGFFVDIGAHHPMRFSNTYILYTMGWRGINIDATPGSMKEFIKFRKEDINIEAAISDRKEILNLYCFDEAALNTFDHSKAKLIQENSPYRLLTEKNIETFTLAEILERNLNQNQKIDFFTIDAEGYDLKVLKSNNWSKYKPEIIVVETSILDLNQLNNDEIYLYLKTLGYKPFAKMFKSVFYVCKEFNSH